MDMQILSALLGDVTLPMRVCGLALGEDRGEYSLDKGQQRLLLVPSSDGSLGRSLFLFGKGRQHRPHPPLQQVRGTKHLGTGGGSQW